jgi:hypothetical protein
MMRFRAVAWSLGISAAATGLYLISLQVAAERGRLEQAETRIMLVKADMRRLNTEMGTRGSLRQLEQWNGEVLALSTPKANQYLQGKVQLASLDGTVLDRMAGPARLIAVNATVPKPAPRLATPTPVPVRPAADVASNLRYATYTPEAQTPAGRASEPVVRKVAFTTVEPAKPLVKPPAAKLDMAPKALLTPAARQLTAKLDVKPKALIKEPAPVAKAGGKAVAAKKPVLQSGTLSSLAKAAKAEGGR